MKITSAVMIYLLFWSLTLFAVLPWRVRTSDEAGARRVPGEADSAPHNPRLGWKLKWTTLISSVLFGLYYLNFTHGWIELGSIRWLQPPEHLMR
ncbi:MAG: DUF1467 family protein [Sphingomonadaceae bacterium]|nr:DUF1467 family protein [Sphingomonadaceae bacterium]